MPTALLLEEDSTCRSTLVAMLKSAGWKVLQPETGTQALRQAHLFKANLDLLIADLRTRGGAQVIKELVEARPDLACLFVSGHPADYLNQWTLLPDNLLRGRRVRFLPKPFTVRALLETVSALSEEAKVAGRA
ncbi:MAG TPA: response regulator [Bryobacteraceae bacterium]|nr:response regulator [Bryobacteraceae bacterium]